SLARALNARSLQAAARDPASLPRPPDQYMLSTLSRPLCILSLGLLGVATLGTLAHAADDAASDAPSATESKSGSKAASKKDSAKRERWEKDRARFKAKLK